MDGTASRSRSPGGRFRASAAFGRWVFAGALAANVAGAPVAASAQIKVEGEVIDAVTGLPVAGAIVHLPDLDMGTISDDLGYFVLDVVPRGVQVVSAHRTGYEAIEQEVRVVPGELWEVRLTPAAIPVRGIEVSAATSQELEVARTGRRSDFLAPSTVAEAAERTNKVLEVLRFEGAAAVANPSGGRYRGRYLLHRVLEAPSVRSGTHGAGRRVSANASGARRRDHLLAAVDDPGRHAGAESACGCRRAAPEPESAGNP